MHKIPQQINPVFQKTYLRYILIIANYFNYSLLILSCLLNVGFFFHMMYYTVMFLEKVYLYFVAHLSMRSNFIINIYQEDLPTLYFSYPTVFFFIFYFIIFFLHIFYTFREILYRHEYIKIWSNAFSFYVTTYIYIYIFVFFYFPWFSHIFYDIYDKIEINGISLFYIVNFLKLFDILLRSYIASYILFFFLKYKYKLIIILVSSNVFIIALYLFLRYYRLSLKTLLYYIYEKFKIKRKRKSGI